MKRQRELKDITIKTEDLTVKELIQKLIKVETTLMNWGAEMTGIVLKQDEGFQDDEIIIAGYKLESVKSFEDRVQKDKEYKEQQAQYKEEFELTELARLKVKYGDE